MSRSQCQPMPIRRNRGFAEIARHGQLDRLHTSRIVNDAIYRECQMISIWKPCCIANLSGCGKGSVTPHEELSVRDECEPITIFRDGGAGGIHLFRSKPFQYMSRWIEGHDSRMAFRNQLEKDRTAGSWHGRMKEL